MVVDQVEVLVPLHSVLVAVDQVVAVPVVAVTMVVAGCQPVAMVVVVMVPVSMMVVPGGHCPRCQSRCLCPSVLAWHREMPWCERVHSKPEVPRASR